jgi:integrase
MLPQITPKPKKSATILIRFRLTQNGKQKNYEMTLPLKWDDRRDRRKAEEIADIIRQDIKHDFLGLQPPAFDQTLQKYRPGLKIAVAPKISSLLDVWVKFVDFKTQQGKVQETTLTRDYPRVENILRKVDPELLKPSNSKGLLSYLTKRYKSSTLVCYYSKISACANWAVKQDIWEKNPYSRDLAILKSQCENPEKSGKAYSDSEAITILEAIATDRFTSPRAYIGHSYYAQFLKFLFLTGIRPQLAIALEWEQIIWEQGRPIKIYFDRAYTSGILKPSKGDRNGKNTPRVFPVNSELADLIMAIPRKKTIHREPIISRHLKTVNRPHYPNLVFPSSRRWYIGIDDFTERVFKPVVMALVDAGEVSEYLPTYHARHTTQNRWLDSGMSEEAISALLDTSPKMIRKHYRDDRRYYENLAQNITLPELGD